MTKPIPIIDTREKIPLEFSDEYFEKPVVKKLDTGDYSIVGLEDILTVERKKSVLEIAANMTQKRFKDAISRVADMKYKILVCEFDYHEMVHFPYVNSVPVHLRRKMRKVSAKWMLSFMLDITIKYEIPVFYAGNSKYASTLTQTYLNKIWTKLS